MNTIERFEQYYIPEPNSGCWLWTAALGKAGYGWFYYPPRNMVRAHVVAWELFRGPRNGLLLLHACDNPACVNPDHLRLGTQLENMRDRDARQRRKPPKGALNGRARVTEQLVAAIRSDPRPPRLVALDYPNIPFSTLKKIRNRQTWKHLP